MRRIKNLENAIYKTRYKEIYKLIFTADIDEINDHSNWLCSGEKNLVELKIPLWMVMESKILNKKSFNIEDLKNANAICVLSNKKRTRYTYDIKKFIEEVIPND